MIGSSILSLSASLFSINMFFLFINFEESFFILLIALMIFGPKKIQEIARSIGYGVRYFKNIKKEIGEVCDKIGELKEITEITGELDDSIKGTIHRNK